MIERRHELVMMRLLSWVWMVSRRTSPGPTCRRPGSCPHHASWPMPPETIESKQQKRYNIVSVSSGILTITWALNSFSMSSNSPLCFHSAGTTSTPHQTKAKGCMRTRQEKECYFRYHKPWRSGRRLRH